MKSVRMPASSYVALLYCSRCSVKRSIRWATTSGTFSMKPVYLVSYAKRGTYNAEKDRCRVLSPPGRWRLSQRDALQTCR